MENPFDASNITGKKDISHWVSHFLLNHGTIALSGSMNIDDSLSVFYIDVSNLSSTTLDTIFHHIGGVCVCVGGEERRLFDLSTTWLRLRHHRHELCSAFPAYTSPQPRRMSIRTELERGVVQLIVGNHTLDVHNLSESGCAFYCLNQDAKQWPPSHTLDCILTYKNKIRIELTITIVRIDYNLSIPLGMSTSVSCRFLNQNIADIAYAVLEKDHP